MVIFEYPVQLQNTNKDILESHTYFITSFLELVPAKQLAISCDYSHKAFEEKRTCSKHEYTWFPGAASSLSGNALLEDVRFVMMEFSSVALFILVGIQGLSVDASNLNRYD